MAHIDLHRLIKGLLDGTLVVDLGLGSRWLLLSRFYFDQARVIPCWLGLVIMIQWRKMMIQRGGMMIQRPRSGPYQACGLGSAVGGRCSGRVAVQGAI